MIRLGDGTDQTRESILGMLRTICPEADLRVADDGVVTTNPPDFCSRRPETPLSLGCQCICDLIASGKTVTVRVREDLSAFGGGRTTSANDDDSVNGTGSDQTVEIENRNRYRQRRGDTREWMDVPDWVILAHELCGHALPGVNGAEREWRPGKPGYRRDWHRSSEQAEDQIRRERGLPPRGTGHGLR